MCNSFVNSLTRIKGVKSLLLTIHSYPVLRAYSCFQNPAFEFSASKLSRVKIWPLWLLWACISYNHPVMWLKGGNRYIGGGKASYWFSSRARGHFSSQPGLRSHGQQDRQSHSSYDRIESYLLRRHRLWSMDWTGFSQCVLRSWRYDKVTIALL